MADATARITFEADIAAVQAATAALQKDIKTKVQAPTESLGKVTGVMAEKVKGNFMAMSQGVRVLAVAVGDTKSEVVNFATNAALQLSIVAEGVKLLAQAWKATLIGAVAAAGIAIGYWLNKLILGTDNIEKQKRAVYGLSAAYKDAIQTLSEWNKAMDESNRSLRNGVVQAQLFGAAGDVQKALHAELQKRIVATTIAIGELAKQQSQAFNQKNEIRLKSLRADLLELWERYRQNAEALKAFILEEEKKTKADTQAKDIVDTINRAYEEMARIAANAKEQIRQLSDEQTIQSNQLIQSASNFMQWGVSLKATLADVYDGITLVGQSISQGLGNAFAQAIVYGQGFKDAMVDMLKSLGATIISFVVEIVTQQLIYYALSALGILKTATAAIEAEITRGALAAARSVYETVPFPANMFLAPVAGAGAIGTMTALAGAAQAAGSSIGGMMAAFAQGGLVTGPMLALVGEGGQDELIAPRSDYEALLEGNRGGMLRATINIDGRRTAEAVVPYVPDVVRSKGIRGL